jgi:centromeric protein E
MANYNKARQQLEDERRALAAFVTKFDSLTAGLSSSSSLSSLSMTPPARTSKTSLARLPPIVESPARIDLGGLRAEPSLLEEKWDGGGIALDDESFEVERALLTSSPKRVQNPGKRGDSPPRGVLGRKENLPAW